MWIDNLTSSFIHPEFLIPDFSSIKDDIWNSYLEYLEKDLGVSIEGKSGYRLFNQKNIDKIIDKFNIWATENKIYFNK